MKVECYTVDEFIECLAGENSVFQNGIRVSISRRSLDTGPDLVKFDVILQASTIVLVDHESQYLLEVGFNCGRDYEDSTQEKVGSEEAVRLKNKLKQYVTGRGWRILPGIINI